MEGHQNICSEILIHINFNQFNHQGTLIEQLKKNDKILRVEKTQNSIAYI